MLNIGIIGAGRIGKVHLESISYHVKNATVTAMADPFMNEETEKLIRSYGVSKVTKDYKDILNDKDIDAVLVCSSTDTHAAISIEAINAGKHVFCEKPVDHSIEKIQAVADALKEHPDIKFQVGFNRRFDHNFAAIRKAYDDGKIGEAHIHENYLARPRTAESRIHKGIGRYLPRYDDSRFRYGVFPHRQRR